MPLRAFLSHAVCISYIKVLITISRAFSLCGVDLCSEVLFCFWVSYIQLTQTQKWHSRQREISFQPPPKACLLPKSLSIHATITWTCFARSMTMKYSFYLDTDRPSYTVFLHKNDFGATLLSCRTPGLPPLAKAAILSTRKKENIF